MSEGLQLDAVTVRRSGHVVLSGISADMARGQIVGIIGPNGAGKSTLLNAIAGLVGHEGRIAWNGRAPDLRQIGYLPQQCQVRAPLSVLETVLIGNQQALGWIVDRQAVRDATDMMVRFGLEGLSRRSMASLSGGQQQLVLLAQRLMRRPDLLLLDEATSALDIRHQMQVLSRLRDYVKETGALVLMAIHDLNLAVNSVDSLMLLKSGHLSAYGQSTSVITPFSIRDAYGVDAEFVTSPSGRTCVLPLPSQAATV